MNRYFQINSKTRHSTIRTNLIAILSLVAVLSGILLFFTNDQQKDKILKSYCGDFGFYGKHLLLMRDNTFRFSYYGCSQANGYVRGTWDSDDKILTFKPEQPDGNLDDQYQLENSELIPFNKEGGEKFVLCEDYEAPWGKNEIDKHPYL